MAQSKQLNQAIIDDILQLLEIILGQNYFQYGSHFYQQNKGIAMGSPISSTLAEIYWQYFEKIHLKHHLETKDIIYYKGYVDGLLVIYDQTKINENTIHDIINPYPTAFPYGNDMVLHFYQQQESSTTKTVHKVINKGLKTYV